MYTHNDILIKISTLFNIIKQCIDIFITNTEHVNILNHRLLITLGV